MTRTRQHRVERALDIVDREEERTVVERRAFGRFVDRIDGMNVDAPARRGGGAATGGVVALSTGPGRADRTSEAVRTAYRETVMAVPHYEDEYDEPLAANLAAEVGADLAARVVDGSLTPMAHAALVTACRRGMDERSHFTSVLDRERSSLRAVNRRLNDHEARAVAVGERIDDAAISADLAACDAELAGLERDCERLVTARQRTIHGRTSSLISGLDERSLMEYLYADLDATCPALADAADCLETVRHYRRRCLR